MARRVIEDMIIKRNKNKGAQNPIKEPSSFLKTLQQDLQRESRMRGTLEQREPLRTPQPKEEPPFSNIPELPPQKDSFFRKWYAFIGLLIVIGAVFIYFSSQPFVVVAVTPKSEIKDINLLVTAGIEGAETDITYTLLEEKEEVSFSIPSTGSKDIDRRAQGQIVIFNSFDQKSQRLTERTRFEGTGGKIFRISNAVNVPGYTIKSGKIVPGSVEVTVYADATGAEYNIGYSDFTIPGLKGNATQFAKIVARSKTEMAGGFSGKIKLYDEAQLLKEKTAREKLFVESLTKKIQEKIPVETTLFSKAVDISFSYDVNDRGEENKPAESLVEVIMKGTIRGVLFKTNDLNILLAKNVYPEEKGTIEVEKLSDLTVAFSQEDALSQKTLGNLTFTLTGKTRFAWVIPDESIKKTLAGTPKDSASYKEIFKSRFSTIISARVESFKPFWIRHFPNDPSKITIKKVLPEVINP